jgi:diguanylate cyclase (GGDEF)-like protein/PAS domain S-box-containing protein
VGVAAQHLDDSNSSVRVAAQLYVNSLKDITIENPAPADIFSSPPTPIQQVTLASAEQRFANQMHLRGLVVWQSPGLFLLQDSSGLLFVECWKDAAVQTGNTVDAVGFPGAGVFGLELADAVVRPSPIQLDSQLLTPLQTTVDDVLKHSLNGRRVHLRARLIGQSVNALEFVYQLEDHGQRFNAILPRTDATREIVRLSPNSELKLTGVALVQGVNKEWPDSLLVLVESPADMVVLSDNSWLTLRRALAILGVMIVAVIAPLVWVTVLRRTVRKQTAIIRARIENELHLETRFRRLFERNLAAVYSWRPDGTIVDCNLAFVRLLGLRTREELIGRSYWEFEVDPEQRDRLKKSLRQEALSNREASLLRDDGQTVHLLANITPVHGPEGITYETTAIDVTLLRQHQAQLQQARDAAVHDALNDALTGLPNRRFLLETLSALLRNAERDGSSVALLYLDLDGFKLVNDSLGHAIGDLLLTQVGASLRSWIREGDILARLGGDEFLVVMDQLPMRDDALQLAERLRETIAIPFEVKGHVVSIGVSIGISFYPEDGAEAEELMQKADNAMYAAKREGKNRVTCYTEEIGLQVQVRSNLENLLRGAVARREIFVHYQPEFTVDDLRLVRFEALARWTHPTLGSIPPEKFIPIAEESGMIGALGAAIMELACSEAVRWQAMMPHPIQVGVNVSSFQFRRNGFVEEVSAILERTGLKPELLQIEVTESAMLGGAQQAAETIDQLRAMGISMAIDDFGTGYSNLSYLPSMAFDALKIDRSFVVNLNSQPESESMIRTLIALAHNLGMRVIVEGVETAEQLELLKVLGANEAQGFLMGEPTANPADHFLSPTAL